MKANMLGARLFVLFLEVCGVLLLGWADWRVLVGYILLQFARGVAVYIDKRAETLAMLDRVSKSDNKASR